MGFYKPNILNYVKKSPYPQWVINSNPVEELLGRRIPLWAEIKQEGAEERRSGFEPKSKSSF